MRAQLVIGESSGCLYTQVYGVTESTRAAIWEVAPLVKCLRHKGEVLNSIPSILCENLGMAVSIYKPSIEKEVTEDTRTH